MDARSIDSERDVIYNPDNPGQIVTHAPKQRFRLGYFDVMCLVVNFMIGKCKYAFSQTFQSQAVIVSTASKERPA